MFHIRWEGLCLKSNENTESEKKKTRIINGERVIYNGVKRYASEKYNWVKHRREPDTLCVQADREDPGAYMSKSGRYVKDIPLCAVEEHYKDSFLGIYRGISFMLTSVCYDTMEITITSGDNRRELKEKMDEIGVHGAPYDRGMYYQKRVPLNSLVEIRRQRYDYTTRQRTEKIISTDEFWSTVLETR